MEALGSRRIRFFTALSQSAMAGMSLLEGLESADAAQAIPTPSLLELKARLRRQEGLAEAMARQPEVFPPWQAAVVRMGEATGRLDLAFGLIAQVLESRRAFWLGLIARLALPLLLLHLAPIILNTPIWAGSGGFHRYINVVGWKLLRVDGLLLLLLLSWPWIKGSAFLARFRRFDTKHLFCTCLSTLIAAGVSMSEAVSISCQAAGKPAPPDWDKNETLVERLAALDLFSEVELGLLRVAELSGTVDTAVSLLADRTRQAGTAGFMKS